MLKEDNVREGFFERGEFETVRDELPVELKGIVAIAFYTGWRIPALRDPAAAVGSGGP